MNVFDKPDDIAVLEAVERLMDLAVFHTVQARRVAAFLLAWQDADVNGGWNPTDLWQVDEAVSRDMLLVLSLLRHERKYPDDFGFAQEMQAVRRSRRIRREAD